MQPVDFEFAYENLLEEALASDEEKNERTKTKVKTVLGGTSFLLDLSDDLLPLIGTRKTYPKSAAAEVAWYLKGDQDVTWLKRYAPFWNKFVEADGKTIESAYGYRWQYHFGRNQLANAIEALRANPSDRRINISAWDPAEDGLGREGQKNVPCPTNFTLSITSGSLHSSIFLRSSDIFVGLPYDVMGHAILMKIIASTLGIEMGTCHFTLANAHLYESHWDMATYSLQHSGIAPRLNLIPWSIHKVKKNAEDFVAMYGILAEAVPWPKYAPNPEVVI